MHTVTEDVGNEILVNQYILCACYHVKVNRFRFAEVVSKGLWPPSSPDLSTCDFYLWRYLEGKVYESNPHTSDELRKNIRSALETTEVTVLRKVYLNKIASAQKCIDS